MQFTMKRSGLILSALLTALAALIVTMALASSASAGIGFCGGNTVNNGNKCWGSVRAMSSANAHGNLTGVCVGADSTPGTCAPTNQNASVSVPYNNHYPWVVGTGSNFTWAWGESFP